MTRPLRFGRFELQMHERRLLVDGAVVPLGGRALDLLGVLAERPGQLVSRQELLDRVWPGLYVEENNLNVQVNALRKALGGGLIATVPGHGYRLTAPQCEAPALRGNADLPRASGLPALRSALLGREDDLATLHRLVDGHRLLTLVGAGGVGKTRLALALLQARRNHYAHGVCFVELGEVDDAAALTGTIAAALGVRPGGGDPVAALGLVLQPLALLLVLDNAEHLRAGVAALVATLMDAAPGLGILVTSQAPLKLAGEHVMRLEPLAVPAGPLAAHEALNFGAVALFVDRAQAADPHFVLDDANAPAVIDLCRRLDGMALALELAAARAPLMGVSGLRASLDDRLKLLTRSRNRAAPARQQTLRATLEWSHALLDAPAQAVYRRLAAMAGSASLALITAVVADAALDEWAVLDGLGVLVELSLVSLLPAAGDDMPRYRLLDSPRALALERLAASGEQATIVQRHRLAMARLFDVSWDEHFSGRMAQDSLHQRVALDFDNGRHALQAALAAGDAESALTLAATMLQQLPRSFGSERSALVQTCEALAGPALPEPVQLRASLAVTWARGMIRPLRLQAPAEQAVSLARALDARQPDRFELYFALSLRAWAAALEGDAASARAALVEVRALEDATWPAHRRFLGALASEEVCVRCEDDVAQALQLTRRTSVLGEARGNLHNAPWGNLINAELTAGDPAAAVQTGYAQLDKLGGSRDDRGLAYVRINLASALLALDRTEEARRVAADGWPQAARYDLQNDWADQLALLAALDARPGVAAQLIGFADAGYGRIEELRNRIASQAVERSLAMATRALGAAEAARWRRLGQDLPAEAIAGLALGEPGPH